MFCMPRTHSQHTQLGVRPKTITDVWNQATWSSATAPYRPAAPAVTPPPPAQPVAPMSLV